MRVVKKVKARGYYADPHSPIASSPLKRHRTSKDIRSPIHRKKNKHSATSWPKRKLINELDRAKSTAAKPRTGWTGRVTDFFSPVLKYLTTGEEDNVIQSTISVYSSDESLDLEKTLFSHSAHSDENDPETQLEEEEEEFDPYCFMKNLPEYSQVANNSLKACLPKKTRRTPPISLVLDLDETLVHCSVEEMENADIEFPVEFNGVNYKVNVRKRPHMDDFLKTVSKMFEVIIFTASQKVYAEKLLNIIDPERKYVQHRLYRDACLPVDGNYLKDLNVLGRDLATVVLVDNSPHAFGYQVNNGIPIESWFEDSNDKELLNLIPFLESLCNVSDVRPLVEKKFKTQDRIDKAFSQSYN